MIQTVIKRDGRIVGFDKERIASAIRKAMLKTDKGEDEELINQIVDRIEIKGKEQTHVDEIQDMVEKELMKSSRKDAAKIYITYRNQRDIARKAKTREVFLEIIEAKNNDITRENANMNADTPAGMMMKFASETTKPFVDDYLLSESSLNAVKNNYLHIHDKDYYPSKSLTCVSSRTKIEIRTANGDVKEITVSELDKYFKEKEATIEPQKTAPSEFLYIKGRNGWTKITGIARRKLTEKDNFYKFSFENGLDLEITGEHLVPVFDNSLKEESLKRINNVMEGDNFISIRGIRYGSEDYIDLSDLLYTYKWVEWKKINGHIIGVSDNNICLSKEIIIRNELLKIVKYVLFNGSIFHSYRDEKHAMELAFENEIEKDDFIYNFERIFPYNIIKNDNKCLIDNKLIVTILEKLAESDLLKDWKIDERVEDETYAEEPSEGLIYNFHKVVKKEKISTKDEVVYDLETVEHWWTANGYIVHNCLQHPLNKILNEGFVAGHGESRPTKRIETASIIGCISMETVQNEMHGGQAIPAFDYYLAPFVRKSYIEEVKALEQVTGKDLKHLYNVEISDYEYKDLDGLEGDERYKQHAINKTVGRVHQSMEAFIHNMNTIHCVDGDELVWVFDESDGRFKGITIREISDTFRLNRYKVLSINKEGKSEWKYIYGASFQGNKDVYEIKGKSGHAVHVTDNHRIATVTENKEIVFDYPKNIKNVVIPKVSVDPVYEIGYKWDITKYSSRKKQNYTLPYIEVNVELCELLGYYVADGCVVGGSEIAFSVCNETEMMERIIYLMKKVYGNDITYHTTEYSKLKKVSQIRFNVGKVWALNWQDVCGHCSKEKKVPFFVLGGTDMMQRSFLRGYLMCDGSIKHGEGYYDASSISEELISGLDLMYLQRGEYQYRNIRVMKDFYDKEKFGNNIYTINFSGNSNKRMKLGLDVHSELEYPKYNKEFSNENYFVEDLKSVELYKENADVYDIAVEDNENFLTASNVIIHNSRGGNQVVFSSINYGTDTSAEGRCVIRELLKSTYEGIGNGSTAIFPIQIWKKKRGVSYLPEDRNYDLYKLACKVAARRFFPNFVNLDATFNQHEMWNPEDPERYKYEVATMGCRTRVFENRFGEKTSIGRGNLSFSTINIVKLAIECMNIENEEERIKKFFEKLDEMLEITASQLCDRYDFQKTALAKQFPLLMSGLWNGSEKLKPTDTVESVLNQGTLGIGFIGLAECLIALTGKHHGESEKSQELGLKIVSHMRDRANEFSERYQHNFSVLATPAEGLSGKFTAKDRKEFGIIKGVTDKIYYTNSNHVPVYYHCSPKHKAEVEGPYHELTRGGHIFYVEIDGDATHNPQAIMDIVDLVDKYNIGYCSVNHNRNRCLDCGYEDAQDNLEVCPKCGGTNIDKLQRITGYLVGTTDRWNKAKLAELHDRVVHK